MQRRKWDRKEEPRINGRGKNKGTSDAEHRRGRRKKCGLKVSSSPDLQLARPGLAQRWVTLFAPCRRAATAANPVWRLLLSRPMIIPQSPQRNFLLRRERTGAGDRTTGRSLPLPDLIQFITLIPTFSLHLLLYRLCTAFVRALFDVDRSNSAVTRVAGRSFDRQRRALQTRNSIWH